MYEYRKTEAPSFFFLSLPFFQTWKVGQGGEGASLDIARVCVYARAYVWLNAQGLKLMKMVVLLGERGTASKR